MSSAMGVPGLIGEQLKGTLADVLGIEIVEAGPERVVAQLAIRDAEVVNDCETRVRRI